MSDINIAVIGSAGVGKSTLIQRALSLRSSPTSIASSQRMSVDNVVYTVSLIELDLESFDIVPDRRIQWPKQIGGHIVPRMDGALLLYDVMNSESIQELPQTLSECIRGLHRGCLLTVQMGYPLQIYPPSWSLASATILKIHARSAWKTWRMPAHPVLRL
jgi:ABC-type dipeptide/oligopeptide/nickel transport system ATPase component